MSDPDSDSLPLLDPQWALSLGESDDALGLPVRRMVDGLLRSGRGSAERIEQAVQANEREAARRQLHGLRGSFGSIGASRLAADCRQLEQQLSLPASDLDQRLLRQWQATMDQTMAALDDWLARYPLMALGAQHAPTQTQSRRWMRQLAAGEREVLEEIEFSLPWLSGQMESAEQEALRQALRAENLPGVAALLATVLTAKASSS